MVWIYGILGILATILEKELSLYIPGRLDVFHNVDAVEKHVFIIKFGNSNTAISL